MTLKTNLESVQRITRKSGVSAYKEDFLSACTSLDFNPNLTLTTNERQEVANYIVSQVSSKMSTTEPTMPTVPTMGESKPQPVLEETAIGESENCNVTLQNQTPDIGTVPNTAITPAVKNALEHVNGAKPELANLTGSYIEEFKAGKASERDTVKRVLKAAYGDKIETLDSLIELTKFLNNMIASKERQFIAMLQQANRNQLQNISALSELADKLEADRASNKQMTQSEMSDFLFS